MPDLITPITQALGGGAVLTGVGYALVVLWRFWTHREERKDLEERAEAQSLDAGFSRLVAAAERQDAEIARQDTRIAALSSQAAEDRGRIEALEKSNRELAEENRTFRTLVGAVIEGLRRKPPDSADTLLDLIFSRAPFLGEHHSKE